MAELPRSIIDGLTNLHRGANTDAVVEADSGASATALLGNGGREILHVLEENLTVSKRRRATGSVRVGTRTDTVEATAEVDLDHHGVEVTRVPVGRVVEEVPVTRAEGDTTVIPVVEERLVLVKQLFLVEELHVRHVLVRERVTETVTLRRQHAVVERMDVEGEPTATETVDDLPQADAQNPDPID